MHNQKNILLILLLFAASANAQFHTLKIPQSSNYVIETQRLGVTDITIEYHSPKVNGRDVWNNTNVIPQNGDPIPWRAGANMNTTIKFSTDVSVQGKPLKAGKYGFHVIPGESSYTLLFAHNNDQWGSYYLDIDQDVTLQVDVKDTVSAMSEKLDYEFIPKSENTMIIGLEWAEKRIPFEVSVDLNTTVLESFRSELLGINTYRWEAWNDAAKWCLNRNINLEEALEWANRSIEGGYNGFAANKNLDNLTTKASILGGLGRRDELMATVDEATQLSYTPMQANNFSIMLLRTQAYDKALEFSTAATKKHPGMWFLELNQGISSYFTGKKKNALKQLGAAKTKTPESFHARITEIIEEVKAGTFKL
ncbi:MAG: DUF2911 domain-containing protein [Bacteroidota bacterium]